MLIQSFSLSIPGTHDDVRRDSFHASDERSIYMVSDGIGRSRGSDIASRLVVDELSTSYQSELVRSHADVDAWIRKAVKNTCLALNRRAKSDEGLRKMSATLTMLVIFETRYFFAQVGDSRGYLFRDANLIQVTEDHSVAYEQMKSGSLIKNEIGSHPNQRLLTRSISASRDFVLADRFEGQGQEGDLFLLCSDGLTKRVTDENITDILRSNEDLAGLGKSLVDEAKNRGENDDITLILIKLQHH